MGGHFEWHSLDLHLYYLPYSKSQGCNIVGLTEGLGTFFRRAFYEEAERWRMTDSTPSYWDKSSLFKGVIYLCVYHII